MKVRERAFFIRSKTVYMKRKSKQKRKEKKKLNDKREGERKDGT